MASRESVWEYPRPPRLEPTSKRLVVAFGGVVLADTTRGYRVLETSHPPVYYFPPEDIRREHLVTSSRTSYCEWKGLARYVDVRVGDHEAKAAGWFYPAPTRGFEPIRDCVAFYPALMDRCTVDGEEVRPQPGGFYGGWITSDLDGPFKGDPGTGGW
jgi:uncharacterized protein (DUF427 family)